MSMWSARTCMFWIMNYDVGRSYLTIHFFFQAEDGIRDLTVTGVQTCALPISRIATARAQVASLLGAAAEEIVFTSGATESDNLAILGVARANADRGRHVLTARTEHKAVLDPCKRLEKEGFSVTYLTPARSGLIEPAAFAAALRPDTVLASIMYANNEIGVGTQRRGEGGRLDQPGACGREIGDAEAFLLEALAGVEHGFVLGACGQHVAAAIRVGARDPEDRQVGGLGGPGCEHDLFRRRSEERGDLRARGGDARGGDRAQGMRRGGVGEVPARRQTAAHGRGHGRIDRRRGRVVEVQRSEEHTSELQSQ